MSTAGQHVILVQHVLFERVKFVGNVSHGHTCLKNSHALVFFGRFRFVQVQRTKKSLRKRAGRKGRRRKGSATGTRIEQKSRVALRDTCGM